MNSMKKKKTQPPVKHKDARVNEAQAGYDTHISITSISEMEMKMRQHTAYMTPEYRMQYLQRLIRITHGDDFSEQKKIFREGRIKIEKMKNIFNTTEDAYEKNKNRFIDEQVIYKNKDMFENCIKVYIDKLGKKVVPYWQFKYGCWNKDDAKAQGLIYQY